MRWRPWFATVLGIVTGLLAVLTLISREWIELLTGWDPDGGDGSVEVAVVVGLAVVCVACQFWSRYEWRRVRLIEAGAARS